MLNLAKDLINLSKFCADQDLVPATSGNFSARISAQEVLITASGKDKANLTEADFLIVDLAGKIQSAGSAAAQESLKPSAETLLHTGLYEIFPAVKYVAHYHSTNSAIIARILYARAKKALILDDFELLKAFTGVSSHDHQEIIPIFANTQDIAKLAEQTKNVLNPDSHAYLIAGHGTYIWAESLSALTRQIEALEALIKCYILEMQLTKL